MCGASVVFMVMKICCLLFYDTPESEISTDRLVLTLSIFKIEMSTIAHANAVISPSSLGHT